MQGVYKECASVLIMQIGPYQSILGPVLAYDCCHALRDVTADPGDQNRLHVLTKTSDK
jgi:hypothetical protein